MKKGTQNPESPKARNSGLKSSQHTFLKKGTFGIFPAELCRGLHPLEQTILSWLWFFKNSDGECFPSLQTLSDNSGIGKTALVNHLKKLEAIGRIRRVRRLDKEKNVFTSTLYQLILSAQDDEGCSRDEQGGCPPNEQPAVRETDEGCARDEQGVVREVNKGCSRGEQKPKPINQNQLNQKDHFAIFWKNFPNKISKKKAQEIFEKLVKPDESLGLKIVAAVEAQIKFRAWKKKRGDFVPEWKHPTTWLNQGCWEDEATIPANSPAGQQNQREIESERVDRERDEVDDWIANNSEEFAQIFAKARDEEREKAEKNRLRPSENMIESFAKNRARVFVNQEKLVRPP